jgi:CubicO group peptidase (beta-lactamase class C family)
MMMITGGTSMRRPGHARAKILVLIAGLQCVVPGSFAAGVENQATDVVWPTKAWPVSSPEEQGMQSGVLARLVDTVGGFKQDSLLITRHGKIVLDAYYAPYQPNITHDLRSVTKSIISTLTAIEIKNGLLDSVDHSVMDLFTDKQVADIDENKKAMTVQHLLDMTSGIAWQEKSYTPDETIMRMYQAPDRTAFVLNQPMSDAPGTKFYYNSGNPYVLSALITRKTGQSAFDFAKKELFGRVGITSARWGRVDAQGVTDGEAGLSLAPHDMARIGYLYLRNGTWDGKEIIPSSWVDRAKEGKVPATFGLHYANLWWSLPEKDAFMAQGRHSQLILVLPKLDIVAVMTGILRDDQFYPVRRLVDDIAAAVKSDQSLPPDAVGQSLLEASVREAATERPSPISKTPELAKQISGKTYQVSSNTLKIKTFVLNLTDPDPFWEITTETGRADQPTGRFSGILGLNGVFRRSPPANYGINASKGRWLDERTFALERRILGHSETQLWVLGFDGNKVEVSFEDTDGSKAKLYGEVKD